MLDFPSKEIKLKFFCRFREWIYKSTEDLYISKFIYDSNWFKNVF